MASNCYRYPPKMDSAHIYRLVYIKPGSYVEYPGQVYYPVEQYHIFDEDGNEIISTTEKVFFKDKSPEDSGP